MMDGELGAFLRSRREALSPARAGLPAGPRRRAAGLRRAEVATLAGVSVEYLTRLEQGRDTRPSIQVLAALAAALQLTEADRDHLHQLAALSHGTELCPRDRRAVAQTVRPTVQALLDQLGHAPAVAVNHLWDVLAGNAALDRLLRPLGALDGERPNLLWHLFADERAQDAYPDWDDVADSYVADLHRLRRGDSGADAFADRLARTVGAPFADRWRLRPVATPGTAVRAVCHPRVGLLRLTVETLHLTDAAHQRVLVHLPADEATAIGLDRLMAQPAQRLHAVGD